MTITALLTCSIDGCAASVDLVGYQPGDAWRPDGWHLIYLSIKPGLNESSQGEYAFDVCPGHPHLLRSLGIEL